MPTDATAQKIAGYFGVTVDDLMNGDILWLTAKDNKLTNALELMANTAASNAVDRTFSTGQKEKPLVNDDEELTEYLEMLRTRPECRMFFSLAKGATKEDVEKAVAIVEALRKAEGRM